MITVSVYSGIEHFAIAPEYAVLLQNWKNGAPRPHRFGNEGQWEENPRLRDSLVYKIHILFPDETLWHPSVPIARRTSDHYLVYTIHWANASRLQVLSIMSPGAHAMSRTSFLAEIERRAEVFQASF